MWRNDAKRKEVERSLALESLVVLNVFTISSPIA